MTCGATVFLLFWLHLDSQSFKIAQKFYLSAAPWCNQTLELMLNHSYKPSRHITEEEQILNIKERLTKLKERIIANVETNIHDKCGENTFYYYWSGLDLSDKIPTDTRTERLRDVITLLCTVKVHTVGRYNDHEESQIVNDLLNGYTVSIPSSKR